MWSPDAAAGTGRRAVLLAGAALAASACGFQPLYRTPVSGAGGAATAAAGLDSIHVARIPNREGQLLRNHLVHDLNHNGRPTSPAYVLTATLTESQSRLAIQSDSSATRANLAIATRYVLTRAGTGAVETRGSTRVVIGYDILQDEFATLSAERAAREKAIRQTSLDIRKRLALALIKPVARDP